MWYKINKIYVWTNLVRPKWKPTSSTIAYYELNWNWNDTKNNYWVTTYTTTNYNSTWYVWAWNPTYTTTRNWKKCAYFDGTRLLQLPSLPIPSNTITLSIWIKLNQNINSVTYFFQLREDESSTNRNSTAFFFATLNWRIYPLWISTTQSTWQTWQAAHETNWITGTLGSWYNLVATFNAGTLKFYVNWSLVDTGTSDIYLRNNFSTPSYIWWKRNRLYPELVYNNCYIQDIIYENKVWTAQEVLDYYNLTK